MSAWYVCSALGLYPHAAVEDRYRVTVPLFDAVKWTQANGKVLSIKKSGTSRHLHKITVNGKKQEGYFVSHNLFQNGGVIEVKTK